MQQIGVWRANNEGFCIELNGQSILNQERCIYAFTDDAGEFLRIGSSKNKLQGRMKAWQRDVTNRILGKRSPTPEHEAQAWVRFSQGRIWARAGTLVETPVGKFECYLDEESILIGRYQPPLNHSKHR